MVTFTLGSNEIAGTYKVVAGRAGSAAVKDLAVKAGVSSNPGGNPGDNPGGNLGGNPTGVTGKVIPFPLMRCQVLII